MYIRSSDFVLLYKGIERKKNLKVRLHNVIFHRMFNWPAQVSHIGVDC